MNNRTDKQLFDAIREGDREALSVLFLRYYHYLLHYGMQMGVDRARVEEVIQELFLYLFESYDRFGEVTQVKAYLFKALRRRIPEKIKQERRWEATHQNWPERVDIRFVPEDLQTDEADLAERQAVLLEALNNLPWRQREAVYLRYYNGLTTREIAGIMGAANQTVLNTLYQALQNLRKHEKLRDLIRFSLPWLMLLD